MASNVLELTFLSRNKTIQMNKKSELRVISISGLESSQYSINTINGNQDGTIITHVKLNPREITITGDVKKNSNEDINRQQMISFFNPKFQGELRVNRNGNEKKISYVVSSFRFTNAKMSEWLQFEIVLDCPNPYFSSIDNFGKNIADITKQFAFPLAIIAGKGKIMGYKTYSNNVSLFNDGDCATGCEIKIKVTKGTVSNPKICLNNKFLQVNVDLKAGDELVINTNIRQKSIKLNGENVIQKINRKSSFFELNVGDNVMTYESDDGYENMSINVYFYKKYLGV